MFDLISIGDSVIDTFLKLHDAEVKCSINRKDCKICMNYGDKIPLDGPPVSMVAGNAANNAVGGSRLGLKTAIYVNEGMENNYHTVLNFQGERTILIYHQPWKYNLPDLDSARWVYLTSLSPSFTDSDLIKQLTAYLERSGAK